MLIATISLIISILLLIMFIIVYINTKNTKIDTKDIYANQYMQTEYLIKINTLINNGYNVVSVDGNGITIKKGTMEFKSLPTAWKHYKEVNK